jgi:hypothetical protein
MAEQTTTAASGQPGVFERAKQDVENFVRHAEASPAGAVIEESTAQALRSHSATLMRSAATLLEKHPGAESVASDVLEAGLGILKLAGITL